ncbi:aldehyde dehydrogenase family 7 member B4 [Tanacetum coccineum]
MQGDYEKAGLYYMASVKEVNKPHYYNKAPRIDMHEPSTWVGKGIVLDSQRFAGMLYEIKLIAEVLGKNSLPASIITSFCGGADIGQAIAADTHIPFVSFTRSSKKVSQRFGKCLLELGGNNALIVLDDANVKLAVRSVLFAAVGTAGQRCTTCRRLLKELEKLGPRKGVISQSVKDVVQSLVDDDLFSKDKIGTSSHCNGESVFLLLESMTHLLTFQVYFWSLPSCAGNQLRNVSKKLESELQSSKKRHIELVEQCESLKKGREDSIEPESQTQLVDGMDTEDLHMGMLGGRWKWQDLQSLLWLDHHKKKMCVKELVVVMSVRILVGCGYGGGSGKIYDDSSFKKDSVDDSILIEVKRFNSKPYLVRLMKQWRTGSGGSIGSMEPALLQMEPAPADKVP